MVAKTEREEGYIRVTVGGATLGGNLLIPEQARGLVAFAHGSGSCRRSPERAGNRQTGLPPWHWHRTERDVIIKPLGKISH